MKSNVGDLRGGAKGVCGTRQSAWNQEELRLDEEELARPGSPGRASRACLGYRDRRECMLHKAWEQMKLGRGESDGDDPEHLPKEWSPLKGNKYNNERYKTHTPTSGSLHWSS